MLVLDWEEEEAIDNTVWVSAWMWQVYQMTGIRPVLYTSASVAEDYDWTGISSQFDLWVACYTQDSAEIPNYSIEDYDLSAWRTILWQYSTAGELDRNVSSLTAEEWQSRCKADDEKVTGCDLMDTLQLMSLSAQ
jgi:GH25 family lysozyme M1 (1,4-beta-N-acetylmuramidase)